MRILYVSHYFPPEMGAPAGRVAGLARQWAQAGQEVHVLTGFPHHPTGVIPLEYRRAFRRGFLREDFHGVRVHRTWIFPAANRGKVRRSLNYLSFMLSAAAVGSLRLPRPDVIIATSPQLLCAAAGHLLARRFRAPLVMEVRDLWPESLVAVGASPHRSPLVKGLERLARVMYRGAAHVVTITAAQRQAVLSAGVPEARVSVVPNSVDAAFFESNGLPPAAGRFIVTYIGTLGMAHRLETLLEAAAILRDAPEISFRIVGEGARRQALEQRARELKLYNVEFVGERPREEVPRWIAESSACAVLLRQSPVFLTVVPSKMLEIMAVGRPILLGVEGEARALLERAGAGLAVPPEDAQELARSILRLRDNPALAQRCGEDGRAFVRREFRREVLAARYLEMLEAVVGHRARAAQVETLDEKETVSDPR
jgi:glycosyltransferase involved in cell wall biosynthesis